MKDEYSKVSTELGKLRTRIRQLSSKLHQDYGGQSGCYWMRALLRVREMLAVQWASVCHLWALEMYEVLGT